jgi:hypothetical protein
MVSRKEALAASVGRDPVAATLQNLLELATNMLVVADDEKP